MVFPTELWFFFECFKYILTKHIRLPTIFTESYLKPLPSHSVLFFTEKINFSLLGKTALCRWLTSIVQQEGYKLNQLNYIFCSDKYLHKINQQYLQHDTYTDIITFDNSSAKGTIEGDIFISIQRVKENAKALEINFNDELHRIMAHGILHLCAYKDKTPKTKQKMTNKEDYYLSLRPFLLFNQGQNL